MGVFSVIVIDKTVPTLVTPSVYSPPEKFATSAPVAVAFPDNVT